MQDLTSAMYGSETWRSTKALTNKIQVFINRSLKSILGIRWYDKMSNLELWKATDQESAEVLLKRRRWTWIGHTLRKPRDNIAGRALQWNPQGQRIEADQRTPGEEESSKRR